MSGVISFRSPFYLDPSNLQPTHHDYRVAMEEAVPDPRRRAGIIRGIIWVLPVVGAVVVPGFFILGTSVTGIVFYHGEMILLGIAIAYVISLVWLARYNARLRCQHRGIATDHPKAAMLKNTLEFFFCQFLLVIAVWFACLVFALRSLPHC